MAQLLWISPFSLHDQFSTAAKECLRVIHALQAAHHQVLVLSPTLYTNQDPQALPDAIRTTLLSGQKTLQFVYEGTFCYYVATSAATLEQMPAHEHRTFAYALPPIIAEFKPDAMIFNSADLLSLSCLTQAQLAHIPTVFVLNTPVPAFFSWRDIDLILSLKPELTAQYVTAQQCTAVELQLASNPKQAGAKNKHQKGSSGKKSKHLPWEQQLYEALAPLLKRQASRDPQLLKSLLFSIPEVKNDQLLRQAGAAAQEPQHPLYATYVAAQSTQQRAQKAMKAAGMAVAQAPLPPLSADLADPQVRADLLAVQRYAQEQALKLDADALVFSGTAGED